MTLYDVDRRLVRGRIPVGVDTVTVEANSPEHAGEVAVHEPHGMGNNIAISCRNVRVAPPPQAWVDEYAPVGPSGRVEGDVVMVAGSGPVYWSASGDPTEWPTPGTMTVTDAPKRRPGRPRKAA